jgi:hypothetical protein
MIRKDYIFDASAKTITFSDPVSIEQIGVITNVVDGVQIYNPMDVTKVGTLAGQVLTLAYNTTTMSDTDALQVFYGNGSPTLSVELDDMFVVLRGILLELATPSTVDLALNRLRTTDVIESGTVTTVTTVSTVANQTLMDTYQARLMAIGIDETAWQLCARSRIS